MRRYMGNIREQCGLTVIKAWDVYVDLLFVLFIWSYDCKGGLISNASSCHVS